MIRINIFKRKVKGFIVTIEVMFAVLLFSYILNSSVYVIKTQMTQKYMYNAFISVAMQTSKWGGTFSNIYAINGKTSNLEKSMERNLRAITKQNVTINASPEKVSFGNSKINIDLTWEDEGYWIIPSKSHTIKIELDSIVQPGSLL